MFTTCAVAVPASTAATCCGGASLITIAAGVRKFLIMYAIPALRPVIKIAFQLNVNVPALSEVRIMLSTGVAIAIRSAFNQSGAFNRNRFDVVVVVAMIKF